jgi:hypothetical protein
MLKNWPNANAKRDWRVPTTWSVVRRLVPLALIPILVLAVAVDSARAQSPSPAASATAVPPQPGIRLTTTSSVYVIGHDTGIPVSGTGFPTTCAGSDVQLSLYAIGVQPFSDVAVPVRPSRPELQQQVSAHINDSGSFNATIPLPAQLAGDPAILAPGIVAPCLDGAQDVGEPVQVAILDTAENPNGSATIVIPTAALNASPNNGLGTYARQVGSLTVSANGVECTTVSLTGGPAIDAEGNARIHIGAADQPAACHEPNAKLTFVNANGQTLFEKYTLLPGITQILQNFASEPPSTSGTPTPSPTSTTPTPTGPAPSTPVAPGPPNTGTGTAPGGTPAPWLIALGTLAVILSATSIAVTRHQR